MKSLPLFSGKLTMISIHLKIRYRKYDKISFRIKVIEMRKVWILMKYISRHNAINTKSKKCLKDVKCRNRLLKVSTIQKKRGTIDSQVWILQV